MNFNKNWRTARGHCLSNELQTTVLHRTGTPRPQDPKDPALTPEDCGCLGSPHCGSSAVAAVSARVDAAAGGEMLRGSRFGAIIIC